MSSPTYLQSLKAQLEPPMRNKLSKLIENFEEESKKPGSNAQRILASMVAMVASIQIAKRIAEEAALTALNIKKMFEKDTQKHSVHVNHSRFDEEENLQNNVTPVDATARLTKQLDEIYAQQNALEKQYQKSLEELETLEKEEINQVLLDKTGVALPPEKSQQIIDFYKTRAAEEPERLTTLKKAMKPSPESRQNNEKDDLAEGQASRAKPVEINTVRAHQVYGVNTRIQFIDILKEMLPETKLNLREILATVNAVAGTMDKYNAFVELAKNNYQQAKSELAEQVEYCKNSLAKAKSVNEWPGPSQISSAKKQPSENQTTVTTPSPTPFSSSKLT